MNTYPAVRDPGSIELLFRKIRTGSLPNKVTTEYLENAGFRRQTDVKLLEMLFFLGFIDSSLAPSELWQNSSGLAEKDFASLLAGALSDAYSVVFTKYPEGRDIDGRTLMEMFKEETGVSDTEAAYMVLTVQVLSDIADFSGTPAASTGDSVTPAVPAPEPPSAQQPNHAPDVSEEPAPKIDIPEKGVTLNITIPPEMVDSEMKEIIKALLKKLS